MQNIVKVPALHGRRGLLRSLLTAPAIVAYPSLMRVSAPLTLLPPGPFVLEINDSAIGYRWLLPMLTVEKLKAVFPEIRIEKIELL